MKEDDFMEKVYIIKNLDCAHCGGKIEEAIASFEEIESAVLNFPMRKLKVSGSITQETERKMNETAQRIEDGVEIVAEDSEISSDNSADDQGIRKQLIWLISGVALYVAAIVAQFALHFEIAGIIMFALAYLLLGHDVLLATVRNLRKGNIFDENFLMSVATIGAFILGDFEEAVGVVLFFKIGEIFENYAVDKSRRAITAAAGLKVDEVDLLVDGDFVRVHSDKVCVDDIIRVKPGERIAVDGIVESGETRLDTSAINGEPVPVSVYPGSKVISGCINLNAVITVRAEATAGNSMIAKIAEAVENASASKPKIDRFITRFAKVYTPIVILISVLTALIPSLITGNWHQWIYTALTFLVISCPCALVLSVPLAYFSGIGAASKLGILFKGGNALETLGNVKAIVFDKTGTVTNGSFTVTNIKTYGKLSEGQILSLCASCEEASSHPVALSIIRYCSDNSIKIPKSDNIREFSGRGVSSEFCGKMLLCGNEAFMTENSLNIPADNDDLLGSVVYVAYDGIVVGRVIVSDTIKKDAAKSVKHLKSMGLVTAMLTGDKSENAVSVAEKLGIDYVSGELMPDGKLDEIKKIREKYGPVMFVGDGINDGPVLAGADVGAAMQTGADLALEAADAVFMKSDLNSVVSAKRIADKTMKISWQNIIFALVIKIAVLAFGLLGHPSMWFAVLADSGTAMLLIMNSVRVLRTKEFEKI